MGGGGLKSGVLKSGGAWIEEWGKGGLKSGGRGGGEEWRVGGEGK